MDCTEIRFSPAVSLLVPGLWHIWHGRVGRGIAWMVGFIISVPLFFPAVLILLLCFAEAVRMNNAARH